MGLNQHLVELALAKLANDPAPSQALNLSMTPGLPGAPGMSGPKGPRGPFSLAGRGVDALGGMAMKHPMLSISTPLAAYGVKKLYDKYNEPSVDKQANLPPAATPPATNAAPVAPAPAAQFGSVENAPVQQTEQPQMQVTTSQGAANVPTPGQGAAMKAPGLVKPAGK